MQAIYRVTLDGQDLTDNIRPRLVSLQITEKRGEAADQLDLVVSDHDGRMAIPRRGVLIEVALGWPTAGAFGRPAGLVDKGTFKVDEVTHEGAPDRITIRARSADFTAALRIRRAQTWSDKTVGDVLGDIAGRHGLIKRVDQAFTGVSIPLLEQAHESDAALLCRLGKEHDAVATIKAGALVFAPIGKGATATGKALPTLRVTRAAGDGHRFGQADREKYSGVTAAWHDKDAAETKTVQAGSTSGAGGSRRLARTYANEAEAQRAADAELSRVGRGEDKLSYTLAIGRPDIGPECGFRIDGLKPEIDAVDWIVEQAVHHLEGDGAGLTTSLELERRP